MEPRGITAPTKACGPTPRAEARAGLGVMTGPVPWTVGGRPRETAVAAPGVRLRAPRTTTGAAREATDWAGAGVTVVPAPPRTAGSVPTPRQAAGLGVTLRAPNTTPGAWVCALADVAGLG